MDRRYGSLFVKAFNYIVGSTSPNTILHLTGLQQLPTDEVGYVQHQRGLHIPRQLGIGRIIRDRE
jgi:hypothetical protein